MPPNGVLVKQFDHVEIALAPSWFDQPKQFENLITWEYRLLRGNGTYRPWNSVSDFSNDFKGTKIEVQFFFLPGIYQLRAKIASGGTEQIIDYVRKKDDPHGASSSGAYNEIYRKGKPDYVGVARAEFDVFTDSGGASTAFAFVRAAQAALGSTAWAESASISLPTGFVAKTGDPKCNIFNYQILNPIKSVPVDSGGAPPRAYDWWNSSFSIAGWSFSNELQLAEPGSAVARYKGQWLGFRVPGTHAHCGILDYDGAWINAGPKNINRYPHITSGDYQTAHFRD